VRFSIDRSGRVLSSTLVRSSGSTLLDKETIELVRRCEPFPRPPESAGGTQFTFSVPVRFSVK
jgi:protein TonB